MDPMLAFASATALLRIPVVSNSVEKYFDLRIQIRTYVKFYGPVGLTLPFLCSFDTWQLAHKILGIHDGKIVLDFLSAQIAQANMVAVTVVCMLMLSIVCLIIRAPRERSWLKLQ